MKKIITALVLIGLISMPVVGLAAKSVTGDIEDPDEHPGESLNLWTSLGKVVDYLFALLIIIATIFLVVAGILFVTAQGDPDKVKKARDFVLWALIGVIVGVLAYALVNFVQGMVGA